MSANGAASGWLAEHQRAQCDGRTALTTFQGQLSDEIFVAKSAAESENPLALIVATAAFCKQMRAGAMLLPGEFAPEALWSFQAEYYRAQVAEGGHAQYVVNSGWTPIAVRCCEQGLRRMLADPHHEIFAHVIRYAEASTGELKKLFKADRYRNLSEAYADFDRRFYELEAKEALMARHRTWLKSLRKLRIVPDGELPGHAQRLASLNPLRMQRLSETAAQQRTRDNDPALLAVRRLCEAAGLRFSGVGNGVTSSVRALWSKGPERRGYALAAVTDRGARTAVFFADGGMVKRRKAVLIEAGNETPLADIALDRAEFEEIVPESARAG